MREHFPGVPFTTCIRENVALAEAGHGQDIFRYAPASAGAKDVAALCRETADRLGRAGGTAARGVEEPTMATRSTRSGPLAGTPAPLPAHPQEGVGQGRAHKLESRLRQGRREYSCPQKARRRRNRLAKDTAQSLSPRRKTPPWRTSRPARQVRNTPLP